MLALKPDGVFLSNGPGDPEPCDYAIEAIREILATGHAHLRHLPRPPVAGARLGRKTLKMKFGHHGANHPVKDLDTGQVLITSQNHGFAVDAATLPANLRATHVSLFDGTCRASRAPTGPRSASRATPRRAPARTTSATCSTAFHTDGSRKA